MSFLKSVISGLSEGVSGLGEGVVNKFTGNILASKGTSGAKKDNTTQAVLNLVRNSKNNKSSQKNKKSSSPKNSQVAKLFKMEDKTDIFGPKVYKFTGYLVTLFILIIILFILLDKVTLYNSKNDFDINIRLSYKILITYVIIIFALLFQYYIINNNHESIIPTLSEIDEIINIFNILAVIFLTYFIYRQIKNIYSDCPLPNRTVCQKKGCTDGLSGCTKYYSLESSNCSYDDFSKFTNGSLTSTDSNITITSPSACSPSLSNFMTKNFEFKEKPPSPSPQPSPSPSPGPHEPSGVSGEDFKKYSELEQEIQSLREEIQDLSKKEQKTSNQIDIPGENKQANIECANDGVCPSESTGCNDQGMCEGFTQISLKEKLYLLNNNTYFNEATSLMDKLECLILNTFTN